MKPESYSVVEGNQSIDTIHDILSLFSDSHPIFAGEPTDTNSSSSDSVQPQLDTSSVETSTDNNAKPVETAPTPDTSNGTLSNTNQTGDETEDTHKSKRLKTDKLGEEEGTQQESSQPEVTTAENQEETLQETEESNHKVVETETESHSDSSIHKEDGQSRVEPQSTAVTDSGDAKLDEKSTEQTSNPQENATKKEETESIEEPKDAETKCKPDAGDMEVDSTSSSEQANGNDTPADKKEESSVDKVVPSIEESNSNEPTESTGSTDEPMDQN